MAHKITVKISKNNYIQNNQKSIKKSQKKYEPMREL